VLPELEDLLHRADGVVCLARPEPLGHRHEVVDLADGPPEREVLGAGDAEVDRRRMADEHATAPAALSDPRHHRARDRRFFLGGEQDDGASFVRDPLGEQRPERVTRCPDDE
jgi:hypothetical protein